MSVPAFRLGNPPGLYDPAPNGYSHASVVEPGTRLVALSGQGGEDADGKLADGFDAQMAQAFANVSAALAWAGATPSDVFKLIVLVVDHSEDNLAVFGRYLNAWHSGMKPTCTLIPVPRLALDGMLVEIEATAAVHRDSGNPARESASE